MGRADREQVEVFVSFKRLSSVVAGESPRLNQLSRKPTRSEASSLGFKSNAEEEANQEMVCAKQAQFRHVHPRGKTWSYITGEPQKGVTTCDTKYFRTVSPFPQDCLPRLQVTSQMGVEATEFLSGQSRSIRFEGLVNQMP